MSWNLVAGGNKQQSNNYYSYIQALKNGNFPTLNTIATSNMSNYQNGNFPTLNTLGSGNIPTFTPTDSGSGSGSNNNKNQKSEFAQNAETGVNIANSVMNAIGGISNMALGWATYAEQKKNSEMQRKLASKQLENLEEIMKQRKDELERLNRVRGNTQRAFSSNTTVTRSVL